MRVQISAPDSAALVGQSLALDVTAFDRVGEIVPAPRLVWESLDTTRGRVNSTGQAILGPSSGDVLILARTEASGLADTISLHAAAECELKWTVVVAGVMNNLAGPSLGPDGTVYALGIPFPGAQEVADLYSVTPRGAVNWSLRLDRTSANGHLVGPDGTIYVTGRTVRAISPSGVEIWHRILDSAYSAGSLMGALPLGGPLVVAGGHTPIALSLLTGDTVWTGPPSPTGRWVLPPSIAHDTAWVKRGEDTLFTFSVATGALGTLKIADPDTGLDLRTFGVGPVPVGARVYLPTAFRLAAFNSQGQLTWLTDDRGRGVTEPVIDAAGRVYVQTNADGLLALEPTAGAWRWRQLAARPRWTWYGGPALGAGGVIYCAAQDGFYAYDTSGALRWEFHTNEDSASYVPFIGAPAIAPDGTVYTYTDTRIYAFWASHPPEPNSPWAMWRHDARRSGVAR